MDALRDGDEVFIAGIMEHIEEAGIHSGDSACILPPQHLSALVLDTIQAQTRALADALNVIGLMNVQFAVKDEEVYLLEVIHAVAALCRLWPRRPVTRLPKLLPV